MFCPKCGAQNADGSQFCGACGQRMHTVVPAEQLQPHAATGTYGASAGNGPAAMGKPNSTTKLIAICVAIVAIALVVAVIVVINFGSSSVKIDEKSFPNNAIRTAAAVQLDIDGDGVLSKEERAAVTSFAYDGQNVIFGRNEEVVDADAIRKDLKSRDSSGSKDPAGISDELESFPNVKAVIMPDAGLTEFDPSVFADAECLDLRGNPIQKLDLSKNKGIRSLLCDPEVELVGLDAANLYYRDLLTKTHSSKGFTYVIEYDMLGRPVTKKSGDLPDSYYWIYNYDEQGRLVSRTTSLSSSDDLSDLYTYNGKGQLASWSAPMDVCPELFSYTYDESGLPVKVTESDRYSDGMSSDLSYKDGVLSSSKAEYRFSGGNSNTTSIQYSFSDSKLANALIKRDESSSTGGSYEESESYSYDGNGLLTKETFSSVTISLTQTEGGFPKKLTYVSSYGGSSSSYEQTYVCNADGYIVKSTTKADNIASWNGDTTYDYVKFVGSYDYLLERRYIPTIRVAIDAGGNASRTYPASSMVSEDTAWGDFSLFVVDSYGPQCFNAQLLGIDPQFLLNPNEISIQNRMVEMYKKEMSGKK